ARQVLVRFDGSQQSLQQALTWLRQQPDIAVVNASWGMHLRRIDGLDATDQEIDQFVRDTGVVWVNAVGNEADLTWTGPATDRNGNGAVDVSYGGEVRDILLVKAEKPFAIVVQWDDWGDSVQPVAKQDLDIYLFVDQGNGQVVLWDRSEEIQNGRQYPMEALSGPGLPGGVGALVIKRKRVDRDVRVRVAVTQGAELLPHEPAFSLASPASARQALAVGAVDAGSRQLASYSSNGPSWDNRLKPEVSAPAGVRSQAYRLEGQDRFHGTSAAAPHVAGFAALLASTGDKPRGAALRTAVEAAIRPMGQPQPNNGYGRGLVVAGLTASGAPDNPPPPVSDKPPVDSPPSGGAEGQPNGNAAGRVNRALDGLLNR
ncbi:MAG: S8 family serine peptidase, partial [Candidatus Competibacter phosphatis]